MFARFAPSTPAPEIGLLGAHLLVGLDGLDVLVRLESLHRALGEVHSVSLLVLFSSRGLRWPRLSETGGVTYEKPLMMLYSCSIVPPCSLALSLTLDVGHESVDVFLMCL